MSVLVCKCKSCDAPITYNIEIGKWKCEYCLHEYEKDEFPDAPVEAASEPQPSPELSEYHCSECGALLLCELTTAASFCLYCKSPTIIESRFTGEFRPQWVIPFAVPSSKAKEIYFNWIKRYFLAPTSMKLASEVETIRALYAPYWLFDCKVAGQVDGEGRNSHSYTSGSYRVTETKHYNVSRAGSAAYTRIPIDGSAHLDNAAMQALEPYDYAGMENFKMEYMSGVMAERFDVPQDEAAKDMQERSKGFLSASLQATTGEYDSFNVQSSSVELQEENGIYAMLPLYILTTLFKGQKYTFLVNGQTGKIFGDPPVDNTRRWVTILVAFLISFTLLVLAGGFIYAD